MRTILAPESREVFPLRHLRWTVCILLVAGLAACGPDADDPTPDEQARQMEQRLAALEESRVRADERLDEMEARLRELEEVESEVKSDKTTKEQPSKSQEKSLSQSEADVVERTARLAEDAGGEVHYIHHPGGDRTVLVTPVGFVEGETPLIVSLHGYGGDSAGHSTYIPLHERVNSHGFALLLPNGTLDSRGNPSWNPTDRCCDSGKSGQDDVAYLTELVAEAEKVRNFGSVYFFGYSNGGFMAYHMACKGLPGLAAVASLAGTSYVEDSSCDGAPAVSVLHIHGTRDDVILFDGDRQEPDQTGDGQPAFYAGAWDMVRRWGGRAGCDWPEQPRPYVTLDLDRHAPGEETQALRLESGCPEGVRIELWIGEGSTHSPGYGEAFTDALLGWLLAEE